MSEVRGITRDDLEKDGDGEWACECFHCNCDEVVALNLAADIDAEITATFHDWQVVKGHKYCDDCMRIFWAGYKHGHYVEAAEASHENADHVTT